ncbi:MAG: hypothetical protein WBP29_09000 [Candidatus Zixiibacteriota bacterium]
MLRFLLFTLAIITMLTFPLFGDDLASDWANTEMTIDGDGDEWRDRTFTYYDNDKTAIALMNDSANIYLIVISRNEATISRLQRGGLSVWLNGEGKKNRDYGLRYRAGRIGKDSRKPPEGMEAPADMQVRSKEMEERQTRLRQLITVFEKKSSSEISNKGEQGPAAAATFGKDIYAVEFKIPIKSSNDSGYGISLAPDKAPTLGLEFGYLTDDEKKEMRDAMPRPEDGGLRMGMGGAPPPGGGMGGGMGGGRGGPGGLGGRMLDQGKQEIWLKVQLATK